MTYLTSSSYDAKRETLVFTTNHFSVYGVGFKSNSLKFTDIANHWAKDSIDFVVSRGLMNGTSATTFDPMTTAFQAGEKPNHTIILEVCKGFFDEGNHIESPLLPADNGMIDRVLGQLEAASVEECSFRATDCIVPKLSEIISDARYSYSGMLRNKRAALFLHQPRRRAEPLQAGTHESD